MIFLNSVNNNPTDPSKEERVTSQSLPMAPALVCTACRQVLRQQLRQLRHAQNPYQLRTTYIRSPNTIRPFSITRSPSAAQPFTKSVEPKIGDVPQEAQAIPDSTTKSIAKELRKRASSITETYVAYGVCENLVKECARQADYTIPQAHEKNVPVPKTKDGEDLGVGTGWWYESKFTQPIKTRSSK